MSEGGYIKAVYDDVIDHLSLYQNARTPKLHFGAFGPDVPTTSETFSIPVLHLPSMPLDPFIEHCRQHPCYIESEVVPDRNGRHTIYLHFYWIDKEQVSRSNRPPKIAKHVRFAGEGYPSGSEFLGYVVLGVCAVVFGLTKQTLFGI